MSINKEQLDSIMESAKQEFNGEIPDEVMEQIRDYLMKKNKHFLQLV